MANLLEQIKSLPTSEVVALIDQVRATCLCIDTKFGEKSPDETLEGEVWNVKATFLPRQDGVDLERVSVRLRRRLKLIEGEQGYLCNIKENWFEDKDTGERKRYYSGIWISDTELTGDASHAKPADADAEPSPKKKKYNFSGK